VLFYNYRGDRPREITKAFVIDDFKGFDRGAKLDLYYATMTEYEAGCRFTWSRASPRR
jgi:2,3-bisphosphoglycerate-independent phosphoglycerate mutase